MTALFDAADHAWFDGQRRAYFPPERNQLAAHLTMFHHLPPSVGAELNTRLTALTRQRPAPNARLAGLLSLGRGVAYRIESPELDAIRAELAGAFHGLLTPQDAAGWRAHVTIQNKVEPAQARRLLNQLQSTFASRDVAISGLASWLYRGGTWDSRSRHMFA